MSFRKYHIYILAFLLMSGHHLKAQQLSLDDALSLAQANNPELRASELEVEKATQQKVIARSLFLPTVNANAQVIHYFQLPPFFGFGETSTSDKIPYGRFGGKDQIATSVVALQPLFNPTGFPAVQRSQLQQRQSVIAARAKQIEILSEIKTNYLQIIILNERIKLTKESLNRNKRVLQDSKSLFIQGKGLRVDTLRAYTSVKNIEPDLVKLSFAVETAKLRLKSLIGIDSLASFTLIDSLTVPSPEALENEETIFEDVIKNNPDYQVLRTQELIARQQTKFNAASRLPVLSLVAQYQVQSQTNSMDYGNAYYPSSSFLGLQLSVPVFTGFSTNARVKQASLSEKQSTLQLTNKHAQLRTKVHQSIANTKEAFIRLESTSIVQETAQLSYNIIQYRYKNGIASRIELTDAELALSTAQSNYLEAVYDYLTARIELSKLRGRIE